MIRTVTYDTATHKIVPLEPTEAILSPLYFLIDEDLATIKKAYCAMIAAQQQLGHSTQQMTQHYVRHRRGKLVNPTK